MRKKKPIKKSCPEEMTIHCHACRVMYNVQLGSQGERAFIATNLIDSSPDLTKIFFCTLECYTEYIVAREFRPARKNGQKPDEFEVKEQRKDYYAARQLELLKNPGVRAYIEQNDFVERLPTEMCELYEEPPPPPISDDWADL